MLRWFEWIWKKHDDITDEEFKEDEKAKYITETLGWILALFLFFLMVMLLFSGAAKGQTPPPSPLYVTIIDPSSGKPSYTVVNVPNVPTSTDQLPEGKVNLYYTDARVDNRIRSIVPAYNVALPLVMNGGIISLSSCPQDGMGWVMKGGAWTCQSLIGTTPPPPTITITIAQTSAIPAGYVGKPFSWNGLRVSGGTPPYVWRLSSGSLPAGLSLSASTSDSSIGVITGTPTIAGAYSFGVTVTDASGASSTKGGLSGGIYALGASIDAGQIQTCGEGTGIDCANAGAMVGSLGPVWSEERGCLSHCDLAQADGSCLGNCPIAHQALEGDDGAGGVVTVCLCWCQC